MAEIDCCGYVHDMSAYFGEAKAQSEVKQYLQKGLASHASALLAAVSTRNVAGASILEVGAGIGSLQIELLKRGARSATSVEASPAYLKAAQTLAGQLGFTDLVQYHLGDFAQDGGSVPPADIVVLHRVVCCYPDMPGLVAAAAGHARQVLALSFPRDRWYVRFFIAAQAMWSRVKGARFRNYVHSPDAIIQVANAAGLRLLAQRFSGTWQIVVFGRSE